MARARLVRRLSVVHSYNVTLREIRTRIPRPAILNTRIFREPAVSGSKYPMTATPPSTMMLTTSTAR